MHINKLINKLAFLSVLGGGSMLNIAICDDLKDVREEMNSILNNVAIKLNIEMKISSFSSGEELVKSIDKEEYFDLIFLDIEMYELSGIDVARYIREKKHNYSTQIAFVTGKGEYVKSVFEVTTLNFIEKPMKMEEIIKTINQVLNMQKRDKQFFTCKIEDEYYSIPYMNIYYFEITKRTIIAYTKKGKISFTGSLKKLEYKLDMDKFLRVHQSFIINKSMIEKIGNHEIKLFEVDRGVPVARDRKSKIIADLLR